MIRDRRAVIVHLSRCAVCCCDHQVLQDLAAVAKPPPALVALLQCALILIAPIEPLYTHSGNVYVDPQAAKAAKIKEESALQHIDSDDSDSDADTDSDDERKDGGENAPTLAGPAIGGTSHGAWTVFLFLGFPCFALMRLPFSDSVACCSVNQVRRAQGVVHPVTEVQPGVRELAAAAQ